MKNQVRPVCSPKDTIWSQTDKLQRCRRLPLEQAKLRQILENNSKGVLIRKWFDRWFVAESLCYRLRCKINHVLISQQHEFRRGRQFFPHEYPQYPPGWIYPFPGPYMFLKWSRKSQPIFFDHECWLVARIPPVQRRFNAAINPMFLAPCIFVSREQEGSGQME